MRACEAVAARFRQGCNITQQGCNHQRLAVGVLRLEHTLYSITGSLNSTQRVYTYALSKCAAAAVAP